MYSQLHQFLLQGRTSSSAAASPPAVVPQGRLTPCGRRSDDARRCKTSRNVCFAFSRKNSVSRARRRRLIGYILEFPRRNSFIVRLLRRLKKRIVFARIFRYLWFLEALLLLAGVRLPSGGHFIPANGSFSTFNGSFVQICSIKLQLKEEKKPRT